MEKSALEKKISEANIAYSSGIPFITDYEYDLLWQELHSIDPDNPLLYHTAQSFQPVHNKSFHKHQIFGTNKAFNMEDLKPFLTRFGNQKLLIEPKYDGCAAVITQTKNGIALTLEGDGKSGKDISNLLTYINYPFELRNFQAVEILLPWQDWDSSYGKNPRNVVAGWLNRKHDKPLAMMTAIPHNFGHLFKEYSYLGDLESMGEFLLETFTEWAKIYPMDGLMIKVADEKQRLISGNNGTTNNWSIAWKPPIQVKDTTVIDIEWNVSRLGRVIPTIIYNPIDLCGTTNSRVTGNNAQWIKDRNIIIGSQITVGKAGEIIPKIIEVKNKKEYKKVKTPLGDFTPMNTPTLCPTCQELLLWDGVHLVCNGDDCISKKIVSIAYFYSHKGIKIDGIGEVTIEKLLRNKQCYDVLIDKPWALLDCTSYNILQPVLDILGQATFTNIINEVASVNGLKNMVHFISGLGLPSLAYKTSLRLCQYLKTGKLDIHVSDKARESFFKAITIYTSAEKEMTTFNFAPLPNPAKAVYCITGTLSMSREEMISFLNAKDYEFSDSVTKRTNYLVVGDSPGKLKIQNADKYNIPQITEEQLMKLINQ